MLDHDGKFAEFVAFQLDLLCISPRIMIMSDKVRSKDCIAIAISYNLNLCIYT